MHIRNVQQLRKRQKEALAARDRFPRRIIVCCGPGCLASGSQKIVDAFHKVLKNRRIKDFSVKALRDTGCHGLCEKGPLVVIEPQGWFYTRVKPKDVEEILERSIRNGEIIDKLLYTDPATNRTEETYPEIGFYSHQRRIALRNLGKIHPAEIDDYIATGGYQALARVLEKMTPDGVIKEVTDSGLRGRGGGGFATGRKWRSCRDVVSDVRYVICNGDEGDPGAFMDRAIMEGDPHIVLEGMLIAAYAVGATEGYVYVREEYPLAVVRLQQAVEQCEETGLMGDNILGSDFSFRVRVARGAGAFVCGESSALMKSVAGAVGEPRAKYIRSVTKGLYDKPTVLNNVETFANVPTIIEKGADWFRKVGTSGSAGTKAFSLVGKVKNTGLIEVPMGITLREIIYDIGGGTIDDRPFKAVQTGGPSGGCLPESKLDLPVDFDTLTEAGSMMGSGGMIVMDDKTCMVDVARYFLSFLVSESCGKCVPCREGLYQLHALVAAVTEGRAVEEDLDRMERLSEVIVRGSLCGLGKSGPNPFLSTIRYFRDDYLAHIRDKRCPAGVCRELIRYEINEKCTGCMACISACAYNAITGKKQEVHVLDQDKCTKCGACLAVCRYEAIDVY
ncbi:MAG TPA: NADH-ubiquinone oxidoreductase-F iron-sulfur binding region domain-containing protein [Acidobacteriota bacterium]|nr:NADH-ubiquinone oxidoreductase-F iron-sulfur binding region domain-containing protein [Acidobacteriota bacterium]